MAETMQKMRRLEEDIAALQDARLVASDRARAASDAVIGAFNSAAERIEGITRNSIKRSARWQRADRVSRS